MSLPTHHPGDPLLLDYASGGMGEGPALVVACHLALCPACRGAVAELETVGGVLLEGIDPVPVSSDCLDRVLARLDEPVRAAPPPPAPAPARLAPVRTALARVATGGPAALPEPLRRYVGGCVESLAWHRKVPGVRVAEVPLTAGAAHLVRIAGGAAVPRHSHDGMELNLVVQGGFTDPWGHFVRGDVAVGDETVDHRPVADAEGCLCLSVTVGSLRLTGPFGRLLNPFLRL